MTFMPSAVLIPLCHVTSHIHKFQGLGHGGREELLCLLQLSSQEPINQRNERNKKGWW